MDLTQLIPTDLGAAGAGGLLVLVVVYLLSANRADRREYQEAIDRAEKRADEAEKRRAAAEARIVLLEQDVDQLRDQRRAAEDRAATAERQLARYQPTDGLP